MTRHLPHFRSTKFTVLAIGGVLSIAAAASATAATWPSASAAPAPAVQDAAVGLRAPGLAAASSQVGAPVVEIKAAQARAAAAQARVAATLAARDHASHVAHEQHVTLLAAQARAAAAARAAQQAAAQQAAAQRQAAQATQQTARQATQPATQQQPTAASGSPQQIAAQMLGQFGWSSGQFSCLDPLWAQESGWNPSAENPGSGAYGIPQALPGSKMASAGPDWATDPATQIRWGLEYIQSTYGSPCAAWSHEEATGWY